MANKHNPLPPLVNESAMDYAQHEQTYEGFVRITKWGIIALAVMVVILYFVIRP